MPQWIVKVTDSDYGDVVGFIGPFPDAEAAEKEAERIMNSSGNKGRVTTTLRPLYSKKEWRREE